MAPAKLIALPIAVLGAVLATPTAVAQCFPNCDGGPGELLSITIVIAQMLVVAGLSIPLGMRR